MMKIRFVLALAGITLLLFATVPLFAQATAESAVKGNILGTVIDPTGAVVPGATVTATGPTGSRTATTSGDGRFMIQLLVPGPYTVKVEATGFKTAEVRVNVDANRTSSINARLQTGDVSQTVEVTANSVSVDTTTSAVTANLNDTLYQNVPLQRNVSSLFSYAPGVTNGGATGTTSPSISGGSGLENQYIADGVNITDNAFGGFGIFSRFYGSVGTGINLTFVKEVDVKTGAFEPQYGKSTGGIVQIVTKSGSNEYHGAFHVYGQHESFQTEAKQADDFRSNKAGKLLHPASYDASGELGGYVPGFKNKLFFFASFDPTINENIFLPPPKAGLFKLGEFTTRKLFYNYAGKLTFKLNSNHTLESSVFGDPEHSSKGPFRRINTDNTTSFSKLNHGTRNWVVRYNGVLSPTWLVDGSFTWSREYFKEFGFDNLAQITDQTQTGGLAGQRGSFSPVGLGATERTEANNYGINFDTSKNFQFLGDHTFSAGYNWSKPIFDGGRGRSGSPFPFPRTNASGNTNRLFSADAAGTLTNVSWRLRSAPGSCTLCPFMNVPGIGFERVLLQATRAEFNVRTNGDANFQTSGKAHTAYVNDSWSPNKYVTINAGMRWDQERITGNVVNFVFNDNWSPRIGITVDPLGDRKTKVFANFGRYAYTLPLDVAERSLSTEDDVFGFRTAPQSTLGPDVNGDGKPDPIVVLNKFGTVNPIPDAAHTLNGATGGVSNAVSTSTQSALEPIVPGTKLNDLDEWVVGVEHQFPHGVVVSGRYTHRNLKRVLEDTGGISPEATLIGVPQTFVIGNVSSSTDFFTNPIQHLFPVGSPAPAKCDPDLQGEVFDTFNKSLGNVCVETLGINGQPAGAQVADGVPDGFPDPVRLYWSVELEVNKSFSENWQMRANWRIAKLFGNFEGALRNDNGQTDPGISSLFDFTEGDLNLLGDQFKPGVLNTDRRNVVNGLFSYTFSKTKLTGLTVGTGVQIASGIPINDLKAHPVYENSGEVPVGGRGALGRTLVTGTVDLHADYPWRIGENKTLHFGADVFNLADSRRLNRVDQNEDLSFGTPNTDFKKPGGFQSPLSARFTVGFVF